MSPTTMSAAPPSPAETVSILSNTAKAVRVMKASWLRVALNLKQIRLHELWRFAKPHFENYEDYILGVLKLNKYVAARMLRAVDYTEERRPEFLERFAERGEEMEVPSFDVVDQLRRAESSFEERQDDFRDIEARVFNEGIGRVHLKRAIDEQLGRTADSGEPPPEAAQSEPPPTVEAVVKELKAIEKRLLKLDVSKDARKLMFRLVETLEKEITVKS